MITVIIPSYLGNYNRAARNRESKLIRAIQSVADQTFTDWELVVVADGCDKTTQIVLEYLTNNPSLVGKVTGIYVKRTAAWSGTPRNVGLDNAAGDIICYLDADDMFSDWHLQFIADGFADHPASDWIWFDDMHPIGDRWQVNKCNVNKYGYCGTANVAHRRLPVRWPKVAQYSTDDWGFIRGLKSHAGAYVGSGGYMVCHLPGAFDV